MTPIIHIAPSILAADFARLGEQIRDAEAGGGTIIHVDIMDGRFVPNLSMGPMVVEAARRSTKLPLDVHLMIVEPDHMIPAFAQAGAETINVHWETCTHLHRTLQSIKQSGCRAGIALNPHTPALLLKEVLYMLDTIIVMTVNPGFGGQSFIAEMLPKIKELRGMIRASGRDIRLEVDGGVNTDTAAACVEAGANVLIAGSAVFTPAFPVKQGIDALLKAIENKKPG